MFGGKGRGLWAIFLRCGPSAKVRCLRCADLSLLLCLLRFFFLCCERLIFVGLFPFNGIVMRFVGERRPVVGGSAMESSGGCGSSSALTGGRRRGFSLAGCEGKAMGGRFPGRIFVAVCFGWENTFLFLEEERGMRSFLEGGIEQWECWQGCIE